MDGLPVVKGLPACQNRFCSRSDAVHVKSPQHILEQKQPHEHYHAADDRHSQIRLGCPQTFRLLVKCHPHIGGKGHDLKEDEGGV